MILPWLTSKQKALTNHYTRSVNFAGYAKATVCIYITNFKNRSTGSSGWGRESTLPHLWSAGAGDGTCPVDPKQQDLNNTGKHRYNQEEFQWGSSIESAAETRDLEPDQ